MKQKLVHPAAVAKADLGLGRMHVDVHPIRRQADEQAIRRIQLMMQHVAIGFLQGMDDQLVAHVAAIHEYMLAIPACRCSAGTDHPAGHPQRPCGRIDRNRVVLERFAQHLTHPGGGGLGVQSQLHPAVVGQGKRRPRIRQRHPSHGFGAMRVFGRLGLEELAPRRGIEKQVLDVDRGAGCARRRRGRVEVAAFGLHPPGMIGIRAAAGELHPRDGGNRRQRLAAKPQARHLFQIGQAGDFAGRVPGQRQQQFVTLDARSRCRSPGCA